MLNPNAKLWVDALRSGDYQQTRGKLTRTEPETGTPIGSCCLGVACEIYQEIVGDLTITTLETGVCRSYDGCIDFLPGKVKNWLGLVDTRGMYDTGSLPTHNDEDRWSFAEIADLVEREPSGMFMVTS